MKDYNIMHVKFHTHLLFKRARGGGGGGGGEERCVKNRAKRANETGEMVRGGLGVRGRLGG